MGQAEGVSAEQYKKIIENNTVTKHIREAVNLFGEPIRKPMSKILDSFVNVKRDEVDPAKFNDAHEIVHGLTGQFKIRGFRKIPNNMAKVRTYLKKDSVVFLVKHPDLPEETGLEIFNSGRQIFNYKEKNLTPAQKKALESVSKLFLGKHMNGILVAIRLARKK